MFLSTRYCQQIQKRRWKPTIDILFNYCSFRGEEITSSRFCQSFQYSAFHSIRKLRWCSTIQGPFGINRQFFSTSMNDTPILSEKEVELVEQLNNLLKSSVKNHGWVVLADQIALMGKANLSWEKVPDEMKKEVLRRFILGCNDRKMKDLSRLCGYLNGFSNMNYKWVLDDDVRNAFCYKISFLLKGANQGGREVATTVFQLGKAGLLAHQLPKETLEALGIGILQHYSEFNSFDVSNIIHGFGKLQVYWSQLPEGAQQRIETAILRCAKDFSAVSLSSFCTGCSEMKYKWFQNAEVKEKICNRIIQLYGTAGKYDERTLANLIYVLGKTGLTADFIPKDVIHALESSIIKCADSFISQHISNIFYGLGGMNIPWGSLAGTTRNSLESILMKKIGEFSDVGLSGFIMGSLKMKYLWFQNKEIRNLVFNKIGQLYGSEIETVNEAKQREFANIVLGMGQIGVKEVHLTTEVFKALTQGLTTFLPVLDKKHKMYITVG